MSEDNLRDATRKIAASARRHLGAHPSPEELIAYHGGRLSAADEERLQDHLSLCPECTATVLDLASFPDVQSRPGGPEPPVPPWQSVRAGLQEEEQEQEQEQEPAEAGEGRPRRGKLFLALAATFLLATLGLSYWLGTLNPRSVEGGFARGDLPLFTLAPQGADRIRGEGRISVPGDRFNLMLYVANPGSSGSYALEATSAGNPRAAAWRLEDLVPTSEGMFLVVGLSRRELPSGRYHLRLYSGPQRLAEYEVLIEYN